MHGGTDLAITIGKTSTKHFADQFADHRSKMDGLRAAVKAHDSDMERYKKTVNTALKNVGELDKTLEKVIVKINTLESAVEGLQESLTNMERRFDAVLVVASGPRATPGAAEDDAASGDEKDRDNPLHVSMSHS